MLEIKALEKSVKVKRKIYSDYTFYSFIDRKKDMKDKKITYGNIPCRFRKNVEIEDGTYIYIKKAYLDWYTKKFQCKPVVFITEFDIDEDKTKKEAVENYLDEMTNLEDEFAFDEELGF